MRATLGFLLYLPLLAGCGTQAEPTAVQYASYDDCLLDKLGRNQTTAAVEIITQACKSKYKKGPSSDSIAPEDEDGLATRHYDGEAGGDGTFPGASENAYVAPAPKNNQPDVVDVFADWDAEIDADIAKRVAASARAAAFHGDACTDDCSGHEAGYQWAEDNGITDPGDCGGNSQSFIEGCEAWAEENG